MAHRQLMNAEERIFKRENRLNNIANIKNKIVIMNRNDGIGKSRGNVNIAFGLVNKGHRLGILDIDIQCHSIAKITNIEVKQITYNQNQKSASIKATKNLWALPLTSIMQTNDAIGFNERIY